MPVRLLEHRDLLQRADRAGHEGQGHVRRSEPDLYRARPVDAIDRATDVMSGKAPAGASLSLTVTALTGFTSGPGIGIPVTATGSGTWSKDTTSSVNVKGGDFASLSYTSASGDVVYVSEYVPQVIVRLGSSEMSGNILTGSVINATLRTSGGTLRAKASIGGGYGYGLAGRWMSTSGCPPWPPPATSSTPTPGPMVRSLSAMSPSRSPRPRTS